MVVSDGGEANGYACPPLPNYSPFQMKYCSLTTSHKI